MAQHEAERAFRTELDRLHASASRRGPAALKATLKSKLLHLLESYKPKLSAGTHQAAMLEAGELLLELNELEAARTHCFERIRQLAQDDGLAASGQQALTQRARAEFGAVESSFLSLMERDPNLYKSASAAALSSLLARARAAIALCTPHEPLYWVVFNGTVLCYRLCRPALSPERAAITIETLGFCALALESMLPLLQSRFLGWRVRVYTALCHAYEASGSFSGAKRAVAHVLEKMEEIGRLSRHDPVPPTKRSSERLAAAMRAFRALQLKYSGSSELGAPIEDLFGVETAHQISSLLELVLDYGVSSKRVIGPASPQNTDAAGEVPRSQLGQEALAAALRIADPLVTLMAEPAKLADTMRASGGTAKEKEAAATEGASVTPAAETAVTNEDDDPAARAAKEEAAAAMDAAANAATTAAEKLPLSLQADLMRELFRAGNWEAVDRLLPPTVARAATALDTVSALAASAATLDSDAKDGTVAFGNSMTAPVALASGGVKQRAAADTMDGTESTVEFPVETAGEVDSAVIWAELQLMQLVRALRVAQEDSSPAKVRAAVLDLARLLEACRSRPLSAAIDSRPDEFGDAALLLWSECATSLTAADEADAAQGVLSPIGAPQSLAHRVLTVRLRPKTSADGPRLAAALAQLTERDSSFSYKISQDGSAYLSGQGELALRVACDRLAQGLKTGKDQGIDVGALLAPVKQSSVSSETALGPDGALTLRRPSLNAAGNVFSDAGARSDDVGDKGAQDTVVLHETLRAAYWTITRAGLRDTQLCATMGLRLASIQCERGAYAEAVSTCRHAIAEIEKARSIMVVELAEAGIGGVPSASAATVLQSLEGASPFSSSKDGLQQALACVHTDLLVWLFRAELALALTKSEAVSRRKFETTRAVQMKRRSHRHIYGRQWEVDRKREAAEDAAIVPLPSHSAAREAQLLAEFEHNPYAKAILLMEMAPYRQGAKERAAVLAEAVEVLERARAHEGQILMASAPSSKTSSPSNGPPPPQLVYRTTDSICVRPCQYTPPKGADVTSCAVFAKVAAAGISVSTNNTEYAGSGEKIALELETSLEEPLRGCVVLSGLPPAASIVFAAAGYGPDGKMVGGIGKTSYEVLTSLPLPRCLQWGYLARVAAQLNVKAVVHRASQKVLASFVEKDEDANDWEISPLLRWRLAVRAVGHSSPAELRTAAQAFLVEAAFTTVSGAGASAQTPVRGQKVALGRAQLEILALQLALAAGDSALAACAAQAAFHSLVPLLRAGQCSTFLLQPLSACLAALSVLPTRALTSIQGGAHLMARLGFETSQLAAAARLSGLATQAPAIANKLIGSEEEGASTPKASETTSANCRGDGLMRTIFSKWLASHTHLAAAVGNIREFPGREIRDALARSADEAAALLSSIEADECHFEFTVQVCQGMLAASPTPNTVAKIRQALAHASELARGASIVQPLFRRVVLAKETAASLEPMPEVLESEEGKDEAARHQLGLSLATLLRAAWLYVKERRSARAHRDTVLPWRAHSKLVLARCAAISPDQPPLAGGEADLEEQGVSEDQANEDRIAMDPSLFDGLDVLAECSRASVLALRAKCPMIVLQAVAMMMNFYSSLPIATLASRAFNGFDPQLRPSNLHDALDPMPVVPDKAWQILLTGTNSVLGVLATMREGHPLGGSDRTSLTLIGASAANLDDAASDGDENESLALAPDGWFELRDTTSDTGLLDYAWVVRMVRISLHWLQLGRQWHKQERLALTFDYLTDGKYNSEILPFLAQAQEKLHGTESADGEPTPAIKQLSIQVARTTSACATSLEKCRELVHNTLGPHDGDMSVEKSEAFALVHRAYAECISKCRDEGETKLLIEALIELGELRLRSGQAKKAAEAWRQALDSTLGQLDVILSWRDLIEFQSADGSTFLASYGVVVTGRALTLCCALAMHSSRRDLEMRLEYALFSAALARALFAGSAVHPSRNIEFAGYRLRELWPGAQPFEAYTYNTLRFLETLQATATSLLQYDLGLQTLPLLSLYKHLATDICRDPMHSLSADVLTAEALTAVGQIRHALDTLGAAYAGADLPRDSLEMPAAASNYVRPPSFREHEPPDGEANADAMAALVGLVPAEHISLMFDKLFLARLDLARVALLLRLSLSSPRASLGNALSSFSNSLLLACEEKLAAIEAGAIVQEQANKDVSLMPLGARDEARAAIRCQTLMLRSQLFSRKGMVTSAVATLREAMSIAQIAATAAQPASAFTVLPLIQLSPVTWLRMRQRLAEAALAQGQLTACQDQLQLGVTEAQAANECVTRHRLLLVEHFLNIQRGELQQSISGLEAWFAMDLKLECLAPDMAVAAIQLATLQLAVSSLTSSEADFARGANAAGVLLRRAIKMLSVSAIEHGLPSSERWPCLEQSSSPGAAKGMAEVPALRNLYVPGVSNIFRARLVLGETLAAFASTDGLSLAWDELTAAAELIPYILSPLPSLTARLYVAKGKVARLRALAFYSPTELSASWGGALSSAKASANADAVSMHGDAELARSHLIKALDVVTVDGPVDPEFEASILLELALLHGAKLSKGYEDFHVNLSAAYILAAAAANKARRTLFVDLPSMAAAPLTSSVPQSLMEELKEAQAIVASRLGATVPSDQSNTTSRQLLHLLSSRMRRKRAPALDEDASEKSILLLQAFLKQACPAFVSALCPTVAPAEKLVPDVKPGLVCIQWMATRPGETRTTMLYVLHKPSVSQDGLEVGSLTLPTAALSSVATLLQEANGRQMEPSITPISLRNECPSANESLQAAVLAIAELLSDARGQPRRIPARVSIEGDSEFQLGEGALAHLTNLFDPQSGGVVVDEKLCAWLRLLLEEEHRGAPSIEDV